MEKRREELIEKGQELRTRREKKNVSQAKMAKELGINPAHLSRMERGVIPITEEVLNKSFKILNDKEEYKVHNKETKNPIKEAVVDTIQKRDNYKEERMKQIMDKEIRLEEEINEDIRNKENTYKHISKDDIEIQDTFTDIEPVASENSKIELHVNDNVIQLQANSKNLDSVIDMISKFIQITVK